MENKVPEELLLVIERMWLNLFEDAEDPPIDSLVMMKLLPIIKGVASFAYLDALNRFKDRV